MPRDDAAVVSLLVDVELLVGQHDERVADGCIAVGMELHGVADDVGNLVERSVVGPVHGPENASLNGLETVVNIRNGALLDDIGGVFDEVRIHHLFETGIGTGLNLGDFAERLLIFLILRVFRFRRSF